jgi:hypothetical protein
MTVADPNKARAAIDPIVPIAVVAGVLLWFITDLLSKTDIGGPGWTLKGNGSIVVLFAGGGALLAFGWLALAFGSRGERGYLNKALLGAAITLVLEVAFGFVPIIVGPENALALQLPLVVGTLGIALAVGIALARGGIFGGLIVTVTALAACLAPLGLMFFLVPIFLPLVVATPALSLGPNKWLIANSLAQRARRPYPLRVSHPTPPQQQASREKPSSS